MKPWRRSKRGTQIDRQLALGDLQDAMGRVQEPPLIYTPEGTPVMTHYKRPDADTPLCPIGKWRVPWIVPVTEAERAFAGVLRLCEDCKLIYEGQNSEEGQAS